MPQTEKIRHSLQLVQLIESGWRPKRQSDAEAAKQTGLSPEVIRGLQRLESQVGPEGLVRMLNDGKVNIGV